jgi:hypothetical protein
MSELARRSTTPAKAAKKGPAKKVAAKKVPGAKAAHGKAAAKKAAKKVPAKKAAAKKAPAKKAAVKKAPAKKAPPHKAGRHHPHKKASKASGGKATESERRSAAGAGPSMGLPQLPATAADPMAVLGLHEPLRLAELRRAWRAFAARHHPDRGGDAVTFARGQHAYDVLRYRMGSHD